MATDAMHVVLTRIKYSIPPTILNLTFKRPVGQPIESVITSSVIKGRCMVDCNLLGGKIKTILLKREYLEQTREQYNNTIFNIPPYTIYRVPPQDRENLPIIVAYNVRFPGYGPCSDNVYGGTSTAYGLAQELLNSHTGQGFPAPPVAEILSGDLIRLNPGQYTHNDWIVDCRLEYDTKMSNLTTSAINTFAELCVAATKYYIYNEMIVNLDRGYVEFGSELSSVKDIIERYEDQNERYLELLPQFSGAALHDTKRQLSLYPYMV